MSLERGFGSGASKHPSDARSSGPVGNDARKEKLKVVIVDVDELSEQAARDAAERALTASKESMTGIGGFFKRMWKHGIAREYYRQKQIARIREAIREGENIYEAEQDPRIEQAAHKAAMDTIVERFSKEYEETIHEGETKQVIGNTEGGREGEMRAEIQKLIRDYASGALDDDNFREARGRVLGAASKVEGGKRASLYADNLLEVAKQARQAVEHGRSLDDLDLDFDVIVGKARDAIGTKANYSAVDRLIEVVKKTPVGVLVNEATLASGVAIAWSLGIGLTKRAASGRIAAALTFGGSAALAAGFTGFAENKRLKEDRRQHAREMAQGRTYEKDKSPRRQEMDAFIHEMQEARTLTAHLRKELYLTTEEGQEMKELDAEGLSAVISHLGDIEARLALANREHIDLIAYSSPTHVEQERFDLDIARAQAKVDLRRAGLPQGFPEGKTFDELLTLATEARMDELLKGEEGIEARNALFNKMKAKKVAKAAVMGAAIGLVAGSIAQETAAFFNDSQEGLVEHLAGGDGAVGTAPSHATPLEWLRKAAADRLPFFSEKLHTVHVPGGSVELPQSLNLVPDDSGYALVEHGKVVAEGINFDTDGTLDQHSEDLLAGHGLIASTSVDQVSEGAAMPVTPQEYLAHHPELGERVHRTLWFDNDTEAPVFDKNELKLWWGGEHNTGIDADGKYSFSVEHMVPGGSYHEGLSANAQELMKEGKLTMLLSLSDETQATPIEVPIGADGSVHIDPDSEIGKMLFSTHDGKARFLGRFAEVAQIVSSDESGKQVHILATHVGDGLDHLPDSVKVPVPLPRITVDAPSDYFLDPPPIVPIFGRRPLEPVNGAKGPAPLIALPPYYYMGAPMTSEERKAVRARMSPTLRESPDAELDAQAEIDRYFKGHKPEYLKHLEEMTAATEPMAPGCKLSICIPVAGHQEGESIERTLASYLNQTADPSTFEVVLFVNQPDIDASGNPIHSDGTLAKIEAFKKAHPELNIRLMQEILPRESARIGLIRKLLNDATLYRARARGVAGDHIMVSNDADTRGIAPEYVSNLIGKFGTQKKTEAFMGQLDWDPESYIRNPLVHIGARLYQYIAMQYRKKGMGAESSGASFAFRSSIYAAIGGYSTEIGLGEDNDLGRRIVLAREGAPDRTGIGFAGARVSRLYTSSRRAEKAIQDGRAFIEQWEKGFSAFDDDVRKVKWEETSSAPDYDDPEVVKKLVGELEATINRTLMVAGSWWSGSQFSPYSRKALGMLGIKYRVIDQNRIKITDATRLIEGLKRYQKDGMEMMARKTGQAVKALKEKKVPKKRAPRSAKPVATVPDAPVAPRKPRAAKKAVQKATPAAQKAEAAAPAPVAEVAELPKPEARVNL